MKTLLVTGVSHGLGRAIAEASVAHGFDTIGIARSPCDINSVRTSQVDVCDEKSVKDYISSLKTLDIVVNNAGIARIRPLLDTPTSELREVLDINVVGAFNVIREAARHMVQRHGGRIINIASDAALKGISQMAPYCASKHALLGMARAVSEEMKDRGVRICTYCPGPIDTEILGPGTGNPKALKPAVIAKTILHIAELPKEMDVQEILVEPANG